MAAILEDPRVLARPRALLGGDEGVTDARYMRGVTCVSLASSAEPRLAELAKSPT